MPGDVTDGEENLLGGQDDRVVPVAADQMILVGRSVADGNVESGGFDRIGRERRDGPLQLYGETLLVVGSLFGVGELVAGGGESNLGVVKSGKVLVCAANGDQSAGSVGDGLGERAYLPDHAVGPDETERRGGRPHLVEQYVAETVDGGEIIGMDVGVQSLQGNGRSWRSRRQPEQCEGVVGPAHVTGEHILLPPAELTEPLCVLENGGEVIGSIRRLPGDRDAVEEPADTHVHLHRNGPAADDDADDQTVGLVWPTGEEHFHGAPEQSVRDRHQWMDMGQSAADEVVRVAASRVDESVADVVDLEVDDPPIVITDGVSDESGA